MRASLLVTLSALTPLALAACAPIEPLDPDAPALAEAEAPLWGTPGRYPWGDLFRPRAAARDCRTRPAADPAWWCGHRDPAPATDACTDDTWLAFRLTDAPCPAAPGWLVTTPWSDAAHPDLQRVCRYTVGPDVDTPALATLPDVRHLRLERDCRVTAPQSLPPEIWQPLEDAFLTQVDRPAFGPDDQVAPVRVALLDSSPDTGLDGGVAPGGESLHGLAMGNIIRAIACPARRGEIGPCAARLDHHLALPRAYGDHYPRRGGAYGSQAELTDALVAALAAWHQDPTDPRLIINLSIGWTAMHGGDPQDPRRFVPLTALWALDLASCQGALTFAAAGNRTAVDAEGATYPAAWTTTPSICDPTRPPIHAVGAVDGRDAPIALGRPGSQPRLVAPGAHVIVADERLDFPLHTAMTGTSISTAAATAAAALVWAWRPDLDAADVADTLYLAGAPLDRDADIDLDGAPPQRRLDTCAALTRACSDGFCPAPAPACTGRPADARPDTVALLAHLHGDPDLVDGDPAPLAPAPDIYDAPYALPQPGMTQCPYCGLQSGLLYGTLEAPNGATFAGAQLHIDDGLDGVTVDLPPLAQGVPFKIDTGHDGEVKGAWLTGQLFIDGKAVDTASEIVIVD